MRISGTEPSSVIISQKTFQKLKRSPKSAKTRINLWIKKKNLQDLKQCFE